MKAATKLTKESQKALLKAPGRRGETLTVTIKAKYGGYTPMEVVKVCDAIKAGDIKRTELKRTEYSPPYKYPRLVPKSTVEMYLVKDPKTQQPKYEALRGRLTMPPKEQPLLPRRWTRSCSSRRSGAPGPLAVPPQQPGAHRVHPCARGQAANEQAEGQHGHAGDDGQEQAGHAGKCAICIAKLADYTSMLEDGIAV